jgi:DNA-binding NarL/FixJ family response regulator
LVVSDGGDDGCGARALQRGARGYISRNAPIAELLHAIRAVSRGEVWIGRKEMASVLDVLLTRLERRTNACGKFAERLSDRESQIADAVRLGLTNKEIGRKLRISPTTVKTHLENIFHKLNVTHRVQLAILAGSRSQRESKPS